MIKVGILGANSKMAGEIIRILINHPETEIISLIAPSLLGRSVSSVHHGLIGETQLNFSDRINLEDLDFVIIGTSSPEAEQIIDGIENTEDLKLVILPDINLKGKEDSEIGLSEINRKALVRGSRKAMILPPGIVPSLIALMPLAHFLLLNNDIQIQTTLPYDIAEAYDENLLADQIKGYLKKGQASFNRDVTLKIMADHDSGRAGMTKIILKNNSLPIEEIEKIYDQIYDDHNFTFISMSDVERNEVEGTQKVIIKITKPDPETLELSVVSDARMRGGAGDVVHVMNLFFGLHEKTGLHLKPSCY